MTSDIITLAHGSGGKLTHSLVAGIFRKHFSNAILDQGDDAAILPCGDGKLAFTTDSFVITPLFFQGGDIGKLAVCGTVNDLVSAGARPLYLSCGFIIEEGFSLSRLEDIAASMGRTAAACNVQVVTGDTKVVPRGAADGVFINTAGIGRLLDDVHVSGSNAMPGDAIILTGTAGDHGCSILLQREELHLQAAIASDCAPLNGLIEEAYAVTSQLHVLRDPTRGGVATTLNEIAQQSGVGMELEEYSIPVRTEVRGVCELLGLDPLYLANEGKMIVILPQQHAEAVIAALRNHPLGRDAAVIGRVVEDSRHRVVMKTVTGGSRIVDMLVGDQLPRIC